MKVEILKRHKHRGTVHVMGDVIDVSDTDMVRLVERGVAKKYKATRPASPKEPELPLFDNPIGDTDGPARDE